MDFTILVITTCIRKNILSSINKMRRLKVFLERVSEDFSLW